MKTIETILRTESRQLERMVLEARRRLKTAPEGRLRIMKKRGGVEYYYKNETKYNREEKTDDNSRDDNSRDDNSRDDNSRDDNSRDKNSRRNNGRYMKKSEVKLAKELAQRDYDEQLVKNAEERIKAINTFLEKYRKTNLKWIYQKMKPYRRELLCTAVISDDEYIRQWKEVEYEGKSFEDDTKGIVTERGERVRSKSEKIIADKLYTLGIPYRYEYPLVLEGNIRIYPDFTILKMPVREEVYLEHFGMMDDNNYVETMLYKLSTYERNGIYMGVNLFITYETSKNPLNTKALDGLIRKQFYRE